MELLLNSALCNVTDLGHFLRLARIFVLESTLMQEKNFRISGIAKAVLRLCSQASPQFHRVSMAGTFSS